MTSTCLEMVLVVLLAAAVPVVEAKDDAPASGASPGFDLRPEADKSYIQIRRGELPGQMFRWRLPEYVSTSSKPTILDHISWQRIDAATWRLRWDASEAVKRQHRCAFWGEVIAGADTVDFNVTIKNPLSSGSVVPDYWIISLVCGPAPAFHDPQGVRTYIRRDGKLITLREALGPKFQPQGMGTFNMHVAPDSPRYDYRTDAPFIARVSQDGAWVVAAVGTRASTGPGYNLSPNTSCLNTNHAWKRLPPGEETTGHFRIYLLRGSVRDVWRRYARDYHVKTAEARAARQTIGAHPDEGGEQATKNLVIDGVKITTGGAKKTKVVRSPWAPATPLRTLALRHAQRPPACAADPVLRWLVDVALRDSGSVDITELRKQRGRFRSAGAFLIHDDENGLWITNGKVGLALTSDALGCGLVSFYDVTQGIELLGARAEDPSPFRLQVVRYRPDGSTGVLNFAQDPGVGPDLSVVTEAGARQARNVAHTVQIDADVAVVSLHYTGIDVPETAGSLAATITVRLDAADSRTRWRSEVAGDLPQAGLAQVRCPILPKLGYAGEVDFMYAWGSQRGVFKRADASVSQGAYPSSQWSLQHFSVSFGPKVSLYVACHDPSAYVKSFRFQPGQELYLSAYVPNTAVQGNARYSQPYDVVVGPIEGDWFDSARLYRQWAVAHAPWAARPLRNRQDVCRRMLKVAYWVRCNFFNEHGNDGDESWAFTQSMMRVPPHEAVDWYARVLEIPYSRLGAIDYGWQKELWDTRLPYWTVMGDKITEELKRQTRLGMSTVVYTNPCWWDPQRPDFTAEVKRAITRNIDGSLYSEKYNARMYEINRSTELFRDVLKKLARQIKGFGSNGIYYDQFSGLLRGGDYDLAKGLPSLGRGGNWLPRARQRAMKEVRRLMAPDFGFVSEFYCETNQHLFDLQSVTIHSGPGEGPLIPAVYSGYVVQYGAGLQHETRPVASVIALGRNFLWGTAFGWTQFCTELKRYYTRHLLKQLVQLRVQLDDFVVFGRMLRPPAFRTSVPLIDVDAWKVYGAWRDISAYDAYEAAMWQAPSGRRALLLMNYDKRSHQVSFSKDTLVGAEPAAELLEPRNGARLVLTAHQFAVDLPGRSAAAILLPTAAAARP